MPQFIFKPIFEELVERRYGGSAPAALQDLEGNNPVLETIFAHKSVRHYKPSPLAPGTVELLAAAAQSASSSSNLQAWSMVAVQEAANKEVAATLCGNQQFIRDAPLLLVFVADLARLHWVCEREERRDEGLDYFEMFLLGALDAALAAQNVAVAAEGLGLGICYVGAARNHPRELSSLLKLPQRTVALFGMTVGVPDDELQTTIKPRLPQPSVLHYETYSKQHWEREIEDYNNTMTEFYQSQGIKNHQSWTQTTANRVTGRSSLAGRDVLREIIEEFGFELR